MILILLGLYIISNAFKFDIIFTIYFSINQYFKPWQIHLKEGDVPIKYIMCSSVVLNWGIKYQNWYWLIIYGIGAGNTRHGTDLDGTSHTESSKSNRICALYITICQNLKFWLWLFNREGCFKEHISNNFNMEMVSTPTKEGGTKGLLDNKA